MRYEAVDTHFRAKNTSGEANPQWMPKDDCNPYFTYDPQKCIVCSRCVRACEEVQGTFALTIEGRGFDSRVSFGAKTDNALSSDCVSCGACVQACPTATLQEKSIIEIGTPVAFRHHHLRLLRRRLQFKAEMRGDELVRMMPYKHGKANRGHSCVKGRFAYGYASHKDRILNPMIRDSINDPWQEVSWAEAMDFAADRMKGIQAKYGRQSVGVITSSRCTNEETYLVQKLTRAVFMNNNTDTCARVCHSPTGYGLGQTFGTSPARRTSIRSKQTDVVMVIGANPTDGHPVFASRLKKRLRKGAKLIVIDPRRTDMVESPHIKAAHHLALTPGTNVAVVTALAHVIVTEGLYRRRLHPRPLRLGRIPGLCRVRQPAATIRPKRCELLTGVPAEEMRAAARLYATGGNGAIYYGLGVTEHSPGLHHRDRHCQPCHADRQHRPARRGREPAARPEQRAGLVRHGVVPARTAGLSPCEERRGARRSSKTLWGVKIDPNRACASPTCWTRRSRARSRASTARVRTSCNPTPTPSMSRPVWRRWIA